MVTRWRGIFQLILGLTVALIFFYMMAPFLVPILLGAVIAILCYPAFRKGSRKLPNFLVALGITIGVAVGFLFPLTLVIYSAAFKVLGLITRIHIPKSVAAGAGGWLDHPFLQKLTANINRFVPVESDWLQEQGLGLLHSVLEKISGFIAGSVAGMPGFVLGFFIVMISTYFFLVDGDRFLKFLSSLSPLQPEKSNELYLTFQNSCRGVVFGLLLSGLVQGFIMMLFLGITGVPDPFLMGIITMVFAMIPLFGSTPIGIGAIVYLFANGKPVMGIVMIVGAIIIGLSDNVIRTLIMKGASQMHPLLALVSVFGAVQLFGATGIFLGPIIAAVFVAILKMAAMELKKENWLGVESAPKRT